MKMKSLIAVLLVAVGLSACSTVKKVVYRIDVPQGNYLEQDKVDQVRVGMNKEQVLYLLGTPMLQDAFAPNRWDYVFILRKGHNEPIERKLMVTFDNKGIVTDLKHDNQAK